MENMPEERPYRPPSRRPAGRPEKTRSPRKAPTAGLQVVAVQSISCAVVILLVLCFKLVGGDAFAQLRAQFNDSIMSNSILATLAGLLESPQEDPAGSGAASSSSESPGDTTSTGSPSSSTGSGTSTAGTDTASSTAGTTLPTGSASSSPTTAGTGTAAASAGQTAPPVSNVRYAPEGATFVPVRSNRLAAAPLDNGTVTSGYGYRKNPTKEGTGFHRGIDIGAPIGTPIHAMYFGVVTQVGTSPSYGNFVRLFHGSGMEVLYAHCSEILVEKDAVIRAGEVVAKVGDTGDTTGPHLHVEALVDGIAYNPAGIVPLDRYV